MTQTAHPYGIVVAEGSWLYDGSVPTKVRVLQCDVAFEAGDYDDEPEDAEGRPGPGFYVQWEFAGGGAGGSLTGPFPTLDEARSHVQKSAGAVRWLV